MEVRLRQGSLKLCPYIGTLVGALLSLLLVVPVAHALPGSAFTAELKSVETSTTQAGAPTELEIVIERKMNRCLDDPIPEYCENLYEEEDFKDFNFKLPAGMFANRDAAPYCNEEVVVGSATPAYPPASNLWVCTKNGVKSGEFTPNPEAMIGYAVLESTYCLKSDELSGCVPGQLFTTLDLPQETPYTTVAAGYIFNAKPRDGEQARLVLLAPTMYTTPDQGGWMKIDLGIKVDSTDPTNLHLRTESRDLPDLIPYFGVEHRGRYRWQESEIYRMTIVLGGVPELPEGEEPLKAPDFLYNTRMCQEQQFSTDIFGYANNGEVDYAHDWRFTPPSGVGTSVVDAFSFRATDCELLPYQPSFSISEDTNRAKAKPAISSIIRQADDEATTKSVEIKLPQFGLNSATTATVCAEANLDQCPDSSNIGRAETDSQFIPEGEGTLSGNIYLTGSNPDGSLDLAINLKGFIPLVLKGKARLESGATVLKFDDLAPISLSWFKTDFKGGDGAVLTNPSSCGSYEIESKFVSHTGKETSVRSPWEISGCENQKHSPTFNAIPSSTQRGKPFGLTLEVEAGNDATKDELVDEVTFVIDRRVKLRTSKLSRRTLGTISAISNSSGLQEVTLKSRKKSRSLKAKKSALNLSPLAAPSLGASIFRKSAVRQRVKKFSLQKNRSDKRLKKRTLAQNFVATKLPRSDYRSVTLDLNPGGETRLLTMPKRCVKGLKLIARIKTKDGKKHFLSRMIRPGCRVTLNKRRRRK